MAGISNKVKKLTDGLFRKKGGNKEGSSPGAPGAPSFAQDMSANLFGNDSAGYGMESGMASPDPSGVGSPSGMQPPSPADGRLSQENLEKIKELENRFSKLDVNFTMVQKENEGIKKTVEKIDQSVIELLSLYEIVSNQVNPFVGDSDGGRDTIERFEKTEKRLNEVGDLVVMLRNDMESINQGMNAPGISPEVEEEIQNLGAKMDSFVDSMESIKKNIEEIGGRTDSLYSKSQNLDQNIIDLAETASNIAERVDDIETEWNNSSSQKAGQGSTGSSNVQENNTGVGDIAEKDPLVRLEIIKKDPTSAVVLLNWIEFLMERVGRNNLVDALDYYMDIGWIGEDVRSQIIAYARGIDYYVEKPTWRLLPEDHTKSLLFIEKLCGNRIDKNMLSIVDREMSKVKHDLEELYGI